MHRAGGGGALPWFNCNDLWHSSCYDTLILSQNIWEPQNCIFGGGEVGMGKDISVWGLKNWNFIFWGLWTEFEPNQGWCFVFQNSFCGSQHLLLVLLKEGQCPRGYNTVHMISSISNENGMFQFGAFNTFILIALVFFNLFSSAEHAAIDIVDNSYS